MNETQLTNKIKNYLHQQGAYVEKIHGGGYQSAGIPDLLSCYKGKFLAIEVKTPTGKGKASDLQRLKIQDIRQAGGVAFITDNLDDVKYYIELIDNDSEIFYKSNKYH